MWLGSGSEKYKKKCCIQKSSCCFIFQLGDFIHSLCYWYCVLCAHRVCVAWVFSYTLNIVHVMDRPATRVETLMHCSPTMAVSVTIFFSLLLSHCSVWRCSPVTMRSGVMSSLPSDFGHCHFISLKCFSPSSTFSSAFSSQSIFWLYTSLHTQRMVARARMLCTIWRLTVATRLIATLICSCSHSQPVNWHTLIGHLVSVKSFMLRK